MRTAENVLSEIRRRVLRLARPNAVVTAGPLLISRTDTSEPDYRISDPLFILMAQGGKRLYFGDRTIEYLTGQCLIVTTTLPLSGHFVNATPRHPALAVSMPLRPNGVAELLPELRRRQPVPATVDDVIGTLTPSPELLDAIARLLRLQDEPANAAILGPLIEREVIWRLLTGPLGASIAQIGLPHSSRTHIAKTITWIRDNLNEPASVADLADIAGMSPSTFHRHFRRTTGMAPLQFHQRLRLQHARSLLVAQSGTVTAIAHTVGYSSPTQFNREYRRLFGLPPGRDADQLRHQS